MKAAYPVITLEGIYCVTREHAMASMAYGLAAFSSGTILLITSGYFMIYISVPEGVRTGALKGCKPSISAPTIQ